MAFAINYVPVSSNSPNTAHQWSAVLLAVAPLVGCRQTPETTHSRQVTTLCVPSRTLRSLTLLSARRQSSARPLRLLWGSCWLIHSSRGTSFSLEDSVDGITTLCRRSRVCGNCRTSSLQPPSLLWTQLFSACSPSACFLKVLRNMHAAVRQHHLRAHNLHTHLLKNAAAVLLHGQPRSDLQFLLLQQLSKVATELPCLRLKALQHTVLPGHSQGPPASH